MSTQTDPILRIRELASGIVQTLGDSAEGYVPVHQWSQPEIDALTLALAAGRPLLVRGEPGTGKTQLAAAGALWLGRVLHPMTINARSEAQDLVYRFDAVRRLSDAQAKEKDLDETHYYEPGPLWRAFDWVDACRYGSLRHRAAEQPTGHVVLIDEIDKADSDLPNSLLEVLGQRELVLPFKAEPLRADKAGMPLIIFTTNEERQLPAAFLRRCIVLSLTPSPDESYAEWLLQRGEAHFGDLGTRPRRLQTDLMRSAAVRLSADRLNAIEAGLPPPGLAEYIDLLSSLDKIAPGRADEQDQWMRQLNAYAFVKASPVDAPAKLSQRRPFDDGETGIVSLPAA